MLTNDTEVIQLVNQLTNQVETELNATNQFRDRFLDSSDSSTDSSTSSVTSDSDKETDSTKKKKVYRFKKKTPNQVDADSDDDESEPKQQTNLKYLKTKGELTIDDLQPVAKLSINLDDKIKLIKMGKVISIVDDKLVVVQSLINEHAKPLDEETILFDSNRKCLGKIFEVFGPVTSPFYSIRFNNSKEIKENDLNVQKDEFIYYAPDSEYTKFIFNVDDLRKVKGSDASWNNDNEPPVECLEYSDDEKEQQAKRMLKQQNRKVNENLDDNDDSDVELLDGSDLSNKKAKMSNNFKTNSFNKSRSVGNFNREQNNRPNYNQRPQMPQSRSEFNFQPQQQHQHFYPPPQPPHNHNYMQQPQQNQFYPYPPPPPQPFSWQPNPNQQNPFMSYPPYYPPFMNYPPQQMRPQMPPQQMPQFNNYDSNNNLRQSPAKVIDKRFVKNQNIVKKSF